MATKKISAMTVATTIADADLVPIVQGGANKISTYELLMLRADNDLRKANLMGSVAVALTFNPYFATATQSFVDGRQYMTPIVIPKAVTVTGVKWQQITQGNYTADNNNRIGLYSVAAGVLTLRASCANDGDLWKGAAGCITKAFTVPYAAPAGLYYIGYLYNQSAQVTGPAIAAHVGLQSLVSALDFTNGNLLSSYFAGADLQPSTTTMATASQATASAFFILY